MCEMQNVNHNGKWIEARLNELAEKTTTAEGIWRAVYTKEDRVAKGLVGAWMEEAGLSVREDAVGNLFGRLPGETGDTVLVGSHLDTVRNGGKYDGAAGIITAIAAVSNLKKLIGERPRKTVEVVALMEEEGSRYGSSYLGSKAIMGKLEEKDLEEKDANGVSIADAMRQAGYTPEKFKAAERKDISAYVELHIEQGPVLDEAKISIGIVESIVGILSYAITVKGKQNHAGTTPMALRLDPVVKTAEFISAATMHAKTVSETATLTVGDIKAYPGMSNVVAGEVRFLLDMRDGNKDRLLKLDDYVNKLFENMKKDGFDVTAEKQCREMPVKLDEEIAAITEKAAGCRGAKAIRMNSGAGHDAQIFAEKLPVGMVFIPSVGGISHSPLEYTSPEALGEGLGVLEEIIKKLAN